MAASILMGVYTTLWGTWVALPWIDTFAVSHHYRVMGQLAPEWAWGVLAIMFGVAMVGGVLKGSTDWVIRGAMAGYFWWTAIMIFNFLAAPSGAIWITDLMVAIYCAFIALNLRVNRNFAFRKEGC